MIRVAVSPASAHEAQVTADGLRLAPGEATAIPTDHGTVVITYEAAEDADDIAAYTKGPSPDLTRV